MSNFVNGEKNIAAIHQGYGKDVSAIYKGSEMIWPDDECLTFTLAGSEYAYIGVYKNGYPPDVTFYYRYPGESWQVLTFSSSATYRIDSSKPILQIKANGTTTLSNNTTTGTSSRPSGFYQFKMTSSSSEVGVYCTGNIMSLLSGATTLPATASYCFCRLFYNCTCLLSAPQLPATTLYTYCYYQMFYGCTNLVTAPALPATTLANQCYMSMFQNCSSLTTAPQLPATTLVSQCYNNMFNGCTSLTTAPVLPATTLASGCYGAMFSGCTNLNYVKAMFTTSPGTSYTYNWLGNVASSGTFVKNSAATWTNTGVHGIPYGWTVETATS